MNDGSFYVMIRWFKDVDAGSRMFIGAGPLDFSLMLSISLLSLFDTTDRVVSGASHGEALLGLNV
jgi:hypothetical protein